MFNQPQPSSTLLIIKGTTAKWILRKKKKKEKRKEKTRTKTDHFKLTLTFFFLGYMGDGQVI